MGRHPVPARGDGAGAPPGSPARPAQRTLRPGSRGRCRGPRVSNALRSGRYEPEIRLRQQELPPVGNPVLDGLPEEQAIEQIDPAVPARGAVRGTAGSGFLRQHQGEGLLDQLPRSHRPEGSARKGRRGGPEQRGEGRLARQGGQRSPGNEYRPVSEEESFRLRIVEDGKPPAFLQSGRFSLAGGEQRGVGQGLASDFGDPGGEVRVLNQWPLVLEGGAGAPGGVNGRRIRRHRAGSRGGCAARGCKEREEDRADAQAPVDRVNWAPGGVKPVPPGRAIQGTSYLRFRSALRSGAGLKAGVPPVRRSSWC